MQLGAVMYALIRKSDNTLQEFVHSTEGYDLALFDVVSGVEDPLRLEWNGAALVEAPPPVQDTARDAMQADQLWSSLQTATPQQVEQWLAANVTDLASARRVLKFLLLAIQQLRL